MLIDSYLQDAIEVDVDCLSDGATTIIAGIMEHIEEAGVHSGDSACALPPHSLSPAVLEDIRRQTQALAKALGVVGLMNVQYAVKDGDVYILEVNPRASRTVPFVAKAVGQPIAKIASLIMAGAPLSDFAFDSGSVRHVAVKEAVFPFVRFPGVDIILGPEMRSTGEVMGLDRDFSLAFAKSQLAAGVQLPTAGTAFVSVRNRDKEAMRDIAGRLIDMGFEVVATRGTADFLRAGGLDVRRVNKVLEGRPHIVDDIKNGDVDLVINTTEGAQAIRDSYTLRRTALTQRIPYYNHRCRSEGGSRGDRLHGCRQS